MKYYLKTVRFALTLALIVTMSCVFGMTAYAAADSASLDFNRIGSVSLVLEDGSGNAVSDGAVTIYQVATLYLDDGNMSYSYTEAFSNCTEELNVEDTSLAAGLAEYITDYGISGTAASIGTDGTVSFGGLDLGLYLVVQTTRSTGYSTISPFLVTVPCAENDVWVYDVDASPKVEVYTEPTGTSTPADTVTPSASTLPQTGQLNWPVPVLAVGGLVLFAIGWFMHVTGRRKEPHAA